MKKERVKIPVDSEDQEIPEEQKQEMREILQRARRAMEKQTSFVNPHNKRMTVRELSLSNFFRGSCGKTMDAQSVGDYFIKLLRDSSAEQCGKVFGRLIRAKIESEKLGHRNRYANEAYDKYSKEFSEIPSKLQLKKYMIARKYEFTDQPGEGDGKGWTSLWKSSDTLKEMKPR